MHIYIYIHIYIYTCATYIQRVRKRFQPFLTIQYSFCSFIFPCCEFISSCYPLWFYFPASDHPANKEASALPQCLEICLFIRSDKFLQKNPPSIGVRLHQSWYRKIVASHWILSNDQTQRNLADIQGNSLLRGSDWQKWRRWDTHVVLHLIPGISPEIKLSWSLYAHSTRPCCIHPQCQAARGQRLHLQPTQQHQQKQYANLCMNLQWYVHPCICMCLGWL